MDETADIYYVDTRNATTDHRTGGGSRPAWVQAPPSRTVYVPPRNVVPPVCPARITWTTAAHALQFGLLAASRSVVSPLLTARFSVATQ